MQPPLPAGTNLQNRYQVLKVLGQGGFGRTYLAEDRNRFGEPCVLKELVPAMTDASSLAKAKDLFHREARILYGIQHPQVPKFSERFEQGNRFFLVQEYIPGKTLRQILDERLLQGTPCSVAEVRQLLLSLLPVLAYLHDRGIIHRDISPDNIILRTSDHLPVLIDFGAVKAALTQSQAASSQTIVGKPSYAPPEQMQTGTVYPSSDLYALAVTAIALLTGKSPDELYDAHWRTWQWQRWVRVSPDLATVLNRMLSDRPGDRYASAREVLAALQSPQPSLPPPVPSSPSPTAVPTQAAGRRPIQPATAPDGSAVYPDSFSAWDRFVQQFGHYSFQVLKQGTRVLAIGTFFLTKWTGKFLFSVLKWIISLIPKWLLLSVLIAGGIWGYQSITGRRIIPSPPSLPKLPSLPQFPTPPK